MWMRSSLRTRNTEHLGGHAHVTAHAYAGRADCGVADDFLRTQCEQYFFAELFDFAEIVAAIARDAEVVFSLFAQVLHDDVHFHVCICHGSPDVLDDARPGNASETPAKRENGVGEPPFLGEQRLRIVPIEMCTGAHDKATPHLDVDAVTARGARLHLVKQLAQLRCRWGRVVGLTQPVAQHVGLPRTAQCLQGLDLRRHANQGRVLHSQFIEQFIGLRCVQG